LGKGPGAVKAPAEKFRREEPEETPAVPVGRQHQQPQRIPADGGRKSFQKRHSMVSSITIIEAVSKCWILKQLHYIRNHYEI
jgi:hypothetical protein